MIFSFYFNTFGCYLGQIYHNVYNKFVFAWYSSVCQLSFKSINSIGLHWCRQFNVVKIDIDNSTL